MKIQRIGICTNNYSSNKTQQSNSNPNFGKIVDVKAMEVPVITRVDALLRKTGKSLDDIFGFRLNHVPDMARRIVGFTEPEDVAAIQIHFDLSTQHLSEDIRKGLELTVKNGPNVSASVAGKGDQFGVGQSANTDKLKAAKQAITEAVREYIVSAGLERKYAHTRRGALMEAARAQDAVARITASY